MVTGTTRNGFAYELSEDVLNDWDLMVQFGKIDEGNVAVLDDAVSTLLGEEQAKKLKEHVKSVDGRVTITGMSEAIQDILEDEQLKNL